MPLLARRAASATERTLVYFRMNMYIRPPMRLSSSPTHQSISGRCWTRAIFRDGSKGDLTVWLRNVCFRHDNRHQWSSDRCPKGAMNGPPYYSITSSTRTRKDSGFTGASAVAVLRLTTRLNLVGCSPPADHRALRRADVC